MNLNAEAPEGSDEPFQSQNCNTSLLWDIGSVVKRVSLAAVRVCPSVWSLQNLLSLGFDLFSCDSGEGLHPMSIGMFFPLCFFLIIHCPFLIELQDLYIINHSYHLHHTLISDSKRIRGKDFMSEFGKQSEDQKYFLLTIYSILKNAQIKPQSSVNELVTCVKFSCADFCYNQEIIRIQQLFNAMWVTQWAMEWSGSSPGHALCSHCSPPVCGDVRAAGWGVNLPVSCPSSVSALLAL